MTNRNICTPKELKEFATNSKLTINNFSEFIETRTDQKYSIIEKEFIKDTRKQFIDNIMHIVDITNFLHENHKAILAANKNIHDRWQETLDHFKDRKKD